MKAIAEAKESIAHANGYDKAINDFVEHAAPMFNIRQRMALSIIASNLMVKNQNK